MHKIRVYNNAPTMLDPRVITRAILATLRAERVHAPCEVVVTVTTDEGIREVNNEYRNVDAATDVLSFPFQEFAPGKFDARDADTVFLAQYGRILLGDMVISGERVVAQAREYCNTRARETAYLTVHSVLHLLGYDHMDEGEDKRQMRAREKAILQAMGFPDEPLD
jgi:probable rRNA maturation factor